MTMSNRCSIARVFSLLWPLALLLSCGGGRETRSGVYANAPVIIISIDTLRADHLPAYGYTQVRTPAIDALRRDGLLFRNAYSHCPMTLPSHVSILTGLLTHQHGVRNNLGYGYDGVTHPGIMQSLKANGYDTGAAVSAYVLRSATGLGGAFDFYDDALITKANVGIGEISRPGSATAAAAESWVAARGDKPFFLLLHLFEPHAPYEAPDSPVRARGLAERERVDAPDVAPARWLVRVHDVLCAAPVLHAGGVGVEVEGAAGMGRVRWLRGRARRRRLVGVDVAFPDLDPARVDHVEIEVGLVVPRERDDEAAHGTRDRRDVERLREGSTEVPGSVDGAHCCPEQNPGEGGRE